jgi:hypothetical protein
VPLINAPKEEEEAIDEEEVEEDEYDEEDYEQADEEEAQSSNVQTTENQVYDEPYFLSPMAQMYTTFGGMMLARKVDMFNPTIVRLLRCVNLCEGVSHFVQAHAHSSISLHLFVFFLLPKICLYCFLDFATTFHFVCSRHGQKGKQSNLHYSDKSHFKHAQITTRSTSG